MAQERVDKPRKRGVLRRLPADLAIYRVDNARHRLPKLFGRGDLVMLGIGVMVGAGVFTLAGGQAASNAGPAVIVSFLIAATVCLLAALSYAELSSTIPVAGSSYTFTYVIFGEIWAWLAGWALMLELLLAASVVARAWSGYFVATLGSFGVGVPSEVADYVSVDSGVNVLSGMLILALTLMIVIGTKLSARFIWTVVLGKIAVVLFVVVIGAFFVHAGNYTPFIPEPQPLPEDVTGNPTVLQKFTGSVGSQFGIFGVFAAASAITFSFIGFDLIATATEDTKEPRKSVPSGILRSVGIVTVLYVAMAVVMVGMQPYTELGTSAPVSQAFAAVGVGWAATVVNVGALLALTTVVMVVLIGQSRVIFAMARDGVLPGSLSRVSRTFSSPARAAVVAGLGAAALTLYPKVIHFEDLLVLGALFPFLLCSVGVIVLRFTQPHLERGFRVPLVPFVPLLAILAIGWLMLNLPVLTWRNFGIWMAVGLLIYLLWGRRHSRLRKDSELTALREQTSVPDARTQPSQRSSGHYVGRRRARH